VQIPGTFAFRAFLVPEIPGCLAVNAFDPIYALDGSCVNTVAALFADGFATTAIGDPYVVTNGATHSATRDR
jgi:hypothetical protein